MEKEVCTSSEMLESLAGPTQPGERERGREGRREGGGRGKTVCQLLQTPPH